MKDVNLVLFLINVHANMIFLIACGKNILKRLDCGKNRTETKRRTTFQNLHGSRRRITRRRVEIKNE
jgi:hypothetical protein